MFIVAPDGKLYCGTPLDITRAMRRDSFVKCDSLTEYLQTAAQRAVIFTGRPLDLTGATEEELATSFIEGSLKLKLLSIPALA